MSYIIFLTFVFIEKGFSKNQFSREDKGEESEEYVAKKCINQKSYVINVKIGVYIFI